MPVINSYIKQPKAQMSIFLSNAFDRRSSGARKEAGVTGFFGGSVSKNANRG
jgi:hypothetical protein